MKIAEKNGFFSISFGAMDSARNENGTQGKARNKGLSVFAGDLRQNTETAIERKRKEIREKAVNARRETMTMVRSMAAIFLAAYFMVSPPSGPAGRLSAGYTSDYS